MADRTTGHSQPGRSSAEGGYALLALLAILGAGVLFLLVRQMSLPAAPQRQEVGLKALATAKQALLGYAATYRDAHPTSMFGYLPCPDTDGDGIADPPCGTSGQTVVGYLPYKTLGLEPLRDETGACLWYGVGANFKNSPAAAAPFTWDMQGNFHLATATGTIRSTPGDGEGGGAAVVFAPGSPLVGQSRSAETATRSCGADTAANFAAYLESAPFGAGGIALGTVNVTEGESSSGTNNDRVLAISPKEIFTALKARADFATHLSSLGNDIKLDFEGRAVLPAPVVAAAAGTKLSGTIAATVAPGTFPNSATSPQYYPYWYNQYRYSVCTNQKTKCLNGGACTGVLLFAGERVAGGPRTAGEAASPGSFLEGANLTSFTGTGTDFAGPSTLTITNPRLAASQDLMYCLNPPEVSFQRDLGDFTDVTAPLSIVGVGGTQSLVNRSGETLVLGNDNATTGHTDADTGYALVTGQLFGCTWYGTTVPFGTGIRAYFKFRIENDTPGQGFTLTLADSSSNATTAMCGNGGRFLGYAGTNANALGIPYSSPVVYSKIGLEFDTQNNADRSDTNANHVALHYWNSFTTVDDDNVHHAASPSSTNEGSFGPDFPTLTSPLSTKRATLTCLNSSTVCPTASDRTFLVRMDIVRAYTPPSGVGGRGTGTYDVKVWVVKSAEATDFPGIDNVAVDFSGTSWANWLESGSILLPPTIYLRDQVTLQDLRATVQVFRNFWVGFTVGQSTVGQRYTVSDFKLKTR